MRKLALLLVLIASRAFAQNADCRVEWKPIAPGLEHRTITCLGTDDLDFHLFRVDAKRWTLDTEVAEGGSTARRVWNGTDAGLVINGNFFDAQRQPLGVVVKSGREVQPVKPSSWQSVFLVTKGGTPMIVTTSSFARVRHRAAMAVQAGPRLVVSGKVVRVHRSYAAARAGVCLQRDGSLVFFATPQDRKFDLIQTARLAKLAESAGGLGCRDAMLFDGGHSTQVYAESEDEKFQVFGDPVPVFVVAKRRPTR